MPAVSASFGAQGNSTAVEGQGVDMAISGTFVGTVQLQMIVPGAGGANAFVNVGAPVTAPGLVSYNAGTSRAWRVLCTAWTSGTINYLLAAARNINLRQ